MSSGREYQAIATPLKGYSDSSGIPVAWPNRVFEKPATGPWIRFTLIDAQGRQIEFGSTRNTHRVLGTLILQVFMPLDQGVGTGNDLGDQLGELYRQQKLTFLDDSGFVRMRDPVVRQIGRSGMYWQTNVTIPFHRDDLP